MYQLHYFPANANAAPHMLLEELGVKYELLLVDRTKDAQKSIKINPNGRIPTLVDKSLLGTELCNAHAVSDVDISTLSWIERGRDGEPGSPSALPLSVALRIDGR